MTDFFESSLPRILFELSNWSVPIERKQLVIYSLLNFGFHAIKNGLNKFKALLFHWPGNAYVVGDFSAVFNRLDLNFGLDENEKIDVLIHVISKCQSVVKRGADVSLLLSDGLLMLFDIFESKLVLKKAT